MENSLLIQDAISKILTVKPEDRLPAMEELFPLIYDELRDMAHRQIRKERSNHTLGTTALVNEAYLKLVGNDKLSEKGRAYFFAAAARTMRHILVDYARQRNRIKRGGDQIRVTLETNQMEVDSFASDILELNDALEVLANHNQRHAQVVECRFFSGLSVEETAQALDVSPRTVKQDWALAKAWLYRKLNHDE